MKDLSDTLQAMKLPEALQRAQQHGLMTTDGRQTTNPRRLPIQAQPLANQQIMSALSSLASLISESKNGHWGIGKDGQYDFIESGAPALIPSRSLSAAEKNSVSPLFPPASCDCIRMHLARLAMIKKIGSASEMTMQPILMDMAFELAEFSQMAVLLAFREIKREESPWMPSLGVLIKACEKWQSFVDSLYRASIAASNPILEISHA